MGHGNPREQEVAGWTGEAWGVEGSFWLPFAVSRARPTPISSPNLLKMSRWHWTGVRTHPTNRLSPLHDAVCLEAAGFEPATTCLQSILGERSERPTASPSGKVDVRAFAATTCGVAAW